MFDKIAALPGITVHREVPASRITSMGVGGTVDWYVLAGSCGALEEVMKVIAKEKVEWMPVGSGTNVVVRDGGYRGVMIRPAGELMEIEVNVKKDVVQVIAGGGAPLPGLVLRAASKGAGGVECLAGIPGTVGGAVAGNAGGRKGSIGEYVKEVNLIMRGGRKVTLGEREIKWEYRRSSIPKGVICRVVLEFPRKSADEVLRFVQEEFEYRRRSQPVGIRTAGCVFLNPRKGKISAGKIIDELGLKGMRVRGARISPVHANFIENEGGATFRDVRAIIDAVREKVKTARGLKLDLEIKIVGEE